MPEVSSCFTLQPLVSLNVLYRFLFGVRLAGPTLKASQKKQGWSVNIMGVLKVVLPVLGMSQIVLAFLYADAGFQAVVRPPHYRPLYLLLSPAAVIYPPGGSLVSYCRAC